MGLKDTASFDRSQSHTRIIDGQVRCITPDFKPKDLQIVWNVQFIVIFVPAWMIPAIFHSLRRESIKNASSASTIGVKSLRPTWFEEIAPTNEPTSETEQDPVLVDGNREYLTLSTGPYWNWICKCVGGCAFAALWP